MLNSQWNQENPCDMPGKKDKKFRVLIQRYFWRNKTVIQPKNKIDKYDKQ